MKELNDTYYNAKSGTCYNNNNDGATTCNFTTTGLNETSRGMIDNAKWYTAAVNNQSTTSQMYIAERGTAVGNADTGITIKRTTNWTGKVGLMSASDYGYASKDCYSSSTNLDAYNTTCANSNWLFNSKNKWQIAPKISTKSDVPYISSEGSVTTGNGNYTYLAREIHPAVYLKTSVQISSGTGTSSDPYILSKDDSILADTTSTHTYDVSKNLTKNPYMKAGYDFIGWSTDSNATAATYENNENVKNLTSVNGGEVNLYAIWGKNAYTITYDLNGGTGCSETKTVTYGNQIGTLCTPTRGDNYLFVGWFDDSTSAHDSAAYYKDHPWYYYADNYTDLYNAFGYNEASLFDHYYNHIMNGTETRRSSQYISTDTYNEAKNKTLHAGWWKMWEGVPTGTYTAGQTVSYGGKNWTVVKDNGENVSLALNGTAGQGAYKTDVQTNLNNAVVNTDVAYGGLIKQPSGSYVSTDSGSSAGYTGATYWTDNTHLYNPTVRNHLQLEYGGYVRGSWNTRNTPTRDEMTITNLPNGVSTKSTTNVGIVSTTSSNYTVSNGKLTLKNTKSSSTPSTGNWSTRGRVMNINGALDINGVTYSPDTTKLVVEFPNYYNVVYSASGSYKSYTGSSSKHANTTRYNIYTCGADVQGKQIVYMARDANYFYYGNQYTGTGWNTTNDTFDTANAISYYHESSGQNWYAEFAGYATNNCTAGSMVDCETTTSTPEGYTRYIRTYHFDQGNYCKKVNEYSLSDEVVSINYRPFIIVRER